MRALISDIHANRPALTAVLAEIDRLGVRDILCLGDIVGYGGEPGACIDLLRERGAVTLLGNHDAYCALGLDCSRSRLVSGIIDIHRTLINEEQRAFLAGASSSRIEGFDRFHHGGPGDPLDQYVYSVGPSLFPEGVRRLFSGHTHVQARIEIGDRLFVNPGSVGQPRDGDNRAAFALFDDENVTLHRIAYDIEAAMAAIRALGIDERVALCLKDGTRPDGRIDTITGLEAP